MCVIRWLSGWIIALSISSAAHAIIDQRALDQIADFADRICSNIPVEGNGTSVRLSARGKSELNSLLKKLVDLDIEGIAEFQSEVYRGVVQADLAKTLENNTNCKLEIWNFMKTKLSGSIDITPADREKIIARFNTNCSSSVEFYGNLTLNCLLNRCNFTDIKRRAGGNLDAISFDLNDISVHVADGGKISINCQFGECINFSFPNGLGKGAHPERTYLKTSSEEFYFDQNCANELGNILAMKYQN